MLKKATGLKSCSLPYRVKPWKYFFLCPLEIHHCTYNQIALPESDETKVIKKASGFYLLDQRMADKVVKIGL